MIKANLSLKMIKLEERSLLEGVAWNHWCIASFFIWKKKFNLITKLSHLFVLLYDKILPLKLSRLVILQNFNTRFVLLYTTIDEIFCFARKKRRRIEPKALILKDNFLKYFKILLNYKFQAFLCNFLKKSFKSIFFLLLSSYANCINLNFTLT